MVALRQTKGIAVFTAILIIAPPANVGESGMVSNGVTERRLGGIAALAGMFAGRLGEN